MAQVILPYEHDDSDLAQIWLAVVIDGEPEDEDYYPAYRDTIDGQRVVWVKFPEQPQGYLWIKDSKGARRADVPFLRR